MSANYEAEVASAYEHLRAAAAADVLKDPAGRESWRNALATGRFSEFRSLARSGQVGADTSDLEAAVYAVTFARHHLEPMALLLRLVLDRVRRLNPVAYPMADACGLGIQAFDLGCGPGTGGLALSAALRSLGHAEKRVSYTGFDHNPHMRSACIRYLGEREPGWTFTATDDVSAAPAGDGLNLVLANFVMNQPNVSEGVAAFWADHIGRWARCRPTIFASVEPWPVDAWGRPRPKPKLGQRPVFLEQLGARRIEAQPFSFPAQMRTDGSGCAHASFEWRYGNVTADRHGALWRPKSEGWPPPAGGDPANSAALCSWRLVDKSK